VGHSLGGAVVAAVAKAAPGKVASLTLIAPAGFTPEVDAEYLRGFAAASTRRELKPLVGRLFADEALVTRQLVDDLLRYKRLDGVDKALTAVLGTLLDGDRQAVDTRALLEGGGVPVTVVWGAADRILPVPDGVELTRVAAGHMPHMEAPGEVLAAVRSHL
jgi:pyruvate dehydrogenase E2 component (dihydrolipoamide acetyltransferase)